MEIAIETQGLTKRFGLVKKLTAVDDLSMKIEKGTVHGFIGPNGAGKSTTIKMLTGALRPTKGGATIFGKPAGTNAAKSHIGYSPEHPNFYSLSAFEFLVYNARICSVPVAQARERADQLLKWMGLEKFRDKNARNFSAGMRQKVSLLQSLIHNPDILVLDEPTANLDPIGRYEVLERIRTLAEKEKKTILVSSHILDELEKVVDHVTIINKGRVIIQSAIGDLRKQFSTNKFIVETADNVKHLKMVSGLPQVKGAKINHEGNIEVIVANSDKFKSALFSKFKGNEQVLRGFYPFRMSLENIFLNVMKEDRNDKQSNL